MHKTQGVPGIGRIFLIGPRGCGKTTIGLLLASKLGADFWDTDLVLGEELGTSIADFVAQEGWERFREQEHRALCHVLEKSGHSGPSVISTGGGMVLREDNRRLLREEGLCLYLQTPVPVLAERLAHSPNAAQRPSLTGKDMLEEIAEVLAARESLYREAAHSVVRADQSPEDICAAIGDILSARAQTPLQNCP